MGLSRSETVRRLFDLFNSGTRDVPTDLVAPEIEFVSPLTEVRGRPYRGYDDARQWLSDVQDQFERWEYQVDEVREEAGAVIASGIVHLRGRASGVELDQPTRWIAHFADDGRVARMEVSIEPSARG